MSLNFTLIFVAVGNIFEIFEHYSIEAFIYGALHHHPLMKGLVIPATLIFGRRIKSSVKSNGAQLSFIYGFLK